MEREFYEVTAALAELVEDGDLELACARCPYAGECEARELFWGCAAWEESMGEDL